MAIDLKDNQPRHAAPKDTTVQINVRVPYHYRETLIRKAQREGRSLNRTIINALVASIPPEQ